MGSAVQLALLAHVYTTGVALALLAAPGLGLVVPAARRDVRRPGGVPVERPRV